MIDPRLAWFAINATCSALLFGWPWHPRFSRFSCRRGSNPPPPGCKPAPPTCPPSLSAADVIRYARWRDEQVWRALTEPVRLDEGRIQRGNGSGGPTNPKPRMIPRGTRSISYPDPGPDRQPTNPFTGKPVKPQPHGGRIIREGQWDPGWNYLDMSTGCQPRPQDGTPNPPSTAP